LVVVVGLAVTPLAARADETQSVVSYAMEGLGTGAGVGLAMGFVATGHEFESGEWKTLLYGTAIGALTGLGVGVVVGVIDASTSPNRPGVGMYIMRDMNLGLGVGIVAGGIIGALVWLDDGRAKDLLWGFAYGALIGVGAGLVLGIIEGVIRTSSGNRSMDTSSRRGLQLSIGMTPPARGAAPLPYPMLTGRF
jgi:hypothetical protein